MQKAIKNKIKTIGLCLALPCAFMGTMLITPVAPASATIEKNYLTDYSEDKKVSNGSFNEGYSGEYSNATSFTGWEMTKDSRGQANGMLIDAGANFSNYKNIYYLKNQPASRGRDSKMLMINSRTSLNEKPNEARKGYKSNEITLDANSYYKFSVDAMVSLDGETDVYSAYASIYLDGLRDKDNKPVLCQYQDITNRTWQTYYFYIATGSKPQTVNLQLYLGGSTTSTGVAFFDEVILEKFAPVTFYHNAVSANYEYVDTFASKDNSQTKFIVDALRGDETIVDTSAYNFDFETVEGSNTLGSTWKAETSSAHALILPVYRSASKPEVLGKYELVGSDLTFKHDAKEENQNALYMFTDGKGKASVTSQTPITIKAHEIYKLSVNVKVSSLAAGTFSLVIKENNYIFDNYDLSSSRYELQTLTKDASSSNSSDNFKNGYTTLEYYLKGHEVYDTQVTVGFTLDGDNGAEGCVVVDNVALQHVDYSTYNDKSDKHAFKVAKEDPEFENGMLDVTENEDALLTYPLKASGFEKTVADEKVSSSGVIYLRNNATYQDMYAGYEWKKDGYPGNPKGYDVPNNLYMMYNRTPSYQSVKAPMQELAKGGYYKLSFDIKTSAATAAIEITDAAGLQLYYQDAIDTNWTNMTIAFRTTESAANITPVIHLGEKDAPQSGFVYFDNFTFETIDETAYTNYANKVDLDDYLLKLGDDAYKFTTTPKAGSFEGEAAKGGVVDGKNNNIGVTHNSSSIIYIAAATESTSTFESVYDFSLEDGKYYKLTFSLQTDFAIDEPNKTKEHDCKYGVSVGLNGYELIEGLCSNGKFTNYTIYFKASGSDSQKFTFKLECDCEESIGAAYLADLAFTAESSDANYNGASDNKEFKKTIFTSKKLNTPEEKPDTPETPSTNGGLTEEQLWLLIPSIITAAAILIAVLGFALRKVKIKKSSKIVTEDYDKAELNRDLVLSKAKETRDAEAAEIRQQIENLKLERETMEKEHKEAVKAARSEGKITKAAEREFRSYSNALARLEEKENILNEQLTTTLSADYLIEVEKRIAAKEAEELKNNR